MSRVKRGVMHSKRRRNLLKKTKGFKWGRKKSVKLATTASHLAGRNAYRGRKEKKQTSRTLWQIKLNAAVRDFDLSYSKFINKLKTNKVELDRKVLSQIAEKHAEMFKKIVEKLK